jgi:hypothetical protein
MLVIAPKPLVIDFHVRYVVAALKSSLMVDGSEKVIENRWQRAA